jgi:hypothetical protein
MNAPYTNIDLKGMPVLLSASMPEEIADSPKAQDLYTAIALLTHEVIAAGGRIVFGGHPSITPLVREAVKRLGKRNVADLYQLRRFEESAPEEIRDDGVFREIHWIEGDGGDIDAELARMRDRMTEAAQAAIFVGGKTADHYGKMPGIRNEYRRFVEKHPEGPVYLVGLLGGEALKLIQEMETGEAAALNGLSDKERRVIHHSTSVDLVTSLIVGDLARKAEGNGKQA